MTHENQRILLTKRLFKEAMLKLLKEKELEKISVTELCREAGLNRATFYRHYEIPRDVLEELQKDLHQTFRKAVPLPKKQEEIRPFTQKLCHFMDSNEVVIKTVLLRDSGMAMALFLSEVMLGVWDELELSVMEEISPDAKKLVCLYNAGGIYLLLHQWFLGTIHKSADEMADCIFELMSKADPESLSRQFGFGQKK